jgi:Zn-dependent protease
VALNQLAALFEFSKIDLIEVARFLLALYLSITVHEAAHAWMANRCGDDTARLMGRMTLNPIVHIDPIGTILIPLMQVIAAGLPLIGWAKPVPVNPVRFRNMRRGEVLVSLAGPASNFIMAVAALVLSWIVVAAFQQGAPSYASADMQTLWAHIGEAVLSFLWVLLMLNLVLFVFNLIPIPPLDGSHILKVFLSRPAAEKLDRFLMPPFNFLILLFVVLPLISPVFNFVADAAAFLVGVWWA